MIIRNFDEVVSQVQSHLPEYLAEHGRDTTGNFKCLNPHHEDKNPSCSMGYTDGLPLFHCFSCGLGGSILHAAHYLEDKPLFGKEFVTDNLMYLAEKYSIPVEHTEITEEEIYEMDTYRAYKTAHDIITSDNHSEAFLNAIAERGWTVEDCKEYGIGSVEDYRTFRDTLKQNGFPATFLNDVDLNREEIFNPDHIIFTIKDEHGRPVGFSSRNLRYTEDKKNGQKYVNQKCTGVKCNIYKKGSRLFGIDQVIKKHRNKSDMVYIFEGYADVVTAAKNGLTAAVALSGTTFSLEQLQLLKDNGFYNYNICTDGDLPGQEAIASILDKTLGGHKDIKVSVTLLPDELDPDDFIRLKGIEAFKSLRQWSAFEWRLLQFNELTEPEIICAAMVPLIVNESSSVAQEKLIRVLAQQTGVSIKAIQQDVVKLQNSKETEKQKARQNVIEKVIRNLQKHPEESEFTIQEAQTSLYNLAKQFDTDSFSEETCLAFLDNQKQYQEEKTGEYMGHVLGNDLQALQDALCGEWKKDTWIMLGAKPNVGKTSLLTKIAYEISHRKENNALVIYHSIDDSGEQVLPKFICVAEGSKKLCLNEVLNPKFYAKGSNTQRVLEKRNTGYSIIRELIKDGRLILKDSNDGNSLSYSQMLISYYKNKYPERDIVYILDNFHKLQDFQTGSGDERIRFKTLSTEMKAMAVRNHISIISTIEYTKLPKGEKPSNTNISECLTGDTLIFNPENGKYIRIDEVTPGSLVATLNEEQKISNQKITALLDKGLQETFEIKTKTGRTLKTTMNHPFFSEKGWTKLSNLSINSVIAIPRKLFIEKPKEFNIDLARLLGYLAGDGTFSFKKGSKTNYKTPGFINSNIDYINDVNSIVLKYFPTIRINSILNKGSIDERFSYKLNHKNPIISWLEELKIAGQYFLNKEVPNIMFETTEEVKANYLAGLFATDGSVQDGILFKRRVSLASRSFKLLQGTQRLLLSLGIQSSIGNINKEKMFKLIISNNSIYLFSIKVPMISKKGENLKKAVSRFYKNSNSDTLPLSFSQELNLWHKQNNKPVRFSNGYYVNKNKRASRRKLETIYSELPENFKKWVNSDIYWDTITSITPLGKQQCYDLTVENTHNFVANDIFCHNTAQLEYDANAIIHLHSDWHEFGDGATHYHLGVNMENNTAQRLPRIEVMFGKNKISGFKGNLWLDFFPDCADWVYVDPNIPLQDAEAAKVTSKENKKVRNGGELYS
jgi:DNA primase catalytic core